MSRNRSGRGGGNRSTGAPQRLSPVPAVTGAGYTFTWNGSRHTLPSASEAAARIPGAVLMDLIPDPNAGALQLAVACLKHSDAHPDTIEALREMPAQEFAKHLAKWLQRGGVALGESERSSA